MRILSQGDALGSAYVTRFGAEECEIIAVIVAGGQGVGSAVRSAREQAVVFVVGEGVRGVVEDVGK
ncbi:MAG TPA: hypothetical protein VGK19_17310 [Capsulimonadaceae bacterium]